MSCLDSIRFEAAPLDLFGPATEFGRVRAALTERAGGVSEGPFRSLNLGRSTADQAERVRANEARVLERLGQPDRVARLRLEHGTTVLHTDEPGLHGMADAVISNRADLILWLTVADCYPLALAAGDWRVLGHCGWRGVLAGLPAKMAAELARHSGLGPAVQRGWIGPGIGACCYEVGPEVATAFPPSALLPSTRGEGRSQLDLRREIERQLLQAGFDAGGLASSGACTACTPERFFSHRRDGVPAGRMAAILWVEPIPSPHRHPPRRSSS